MIRTALTLAALLATTVAHAQGSIFYNTVDPEEGVPLYRRTKLPPDGWMSPEDRRLMALSLSTFSPPAPLPAPLPVLEPVVMLGGRGGSIMEHQHRFWALQQQGVPVEMRGGCWSACTLLTAYIPKQKLCFAPGSFLAFHSARTFQSPAPKLEATLEMYRSYPVEIQHWIDDHGGPYKMTVDSYWTMYDRDLWAIGYARCK